MKGSSDAVKDAADRLSELEKKRTSAMESSRIIIRKTKRMIHAIHTGETYDPISDELRDDVRILTDDLKDDPSVYHSAVVQDSLSEYAEAMIFAAVIEGKDIPTYEGLGITPQAWVMGLADSIGEIRRMILTHLMDGDNEKATGLFRIMDDIGDSVLSLDVPDAIAPIRRKQDIARSILEKTRSDITNATMLAQYK